MKNKKTTETEIPIWKRFEELDGRSYLRNSVLRAIRDKKFETALGLVCMYEDHMYSHRGYARSRGLMDPHITEIVSALEERIKTSLTCSRILGETNNPFAYNLFNSTYDRAIDNLLNLCKNLESGIEYDLMRVERDLANGKKDGYLSFDFYSRSDEAIKLAEKGLRWSNSLNHIEKSDRKDAKRRTKKGVHSFSGYAFPNRIFSGERGREEKIESYKDLFSQKLEEVKRLREMGYQMDLDWRREREFRRNKSKIKEIIPEKDKPKVSLISRLKKIFN